MKIRFLLFPIGLGLLFSGCAYRTNSDISFDSNKVGDYREDIIVTKKSLSEYECSNIKEIEASVKKATMFHSDPTEEQANYILAEMAKKIDANAVTNVEYKSGVGLTTWGYIDAKGMAKNCDFNKKKESK